ncbi:receptor-type tyrosine-protein phosphatase delta-like isoform X14 [Synchiropus splendidus]|uniref:receptor-type tyrosine-protein phosphatase delta-like isoform X14 n=1 Tax=Synchiropus splendidus TaxID=270530 RepID=UPI00237E8108|nr:receptor-type tyrosine-protein phosphatase delta-like isoform X14 [Synchiropus splendidus]XP_053713418.1 receptor-type tyrosine-protein phosphatase delta-like isoform X14 [Synchiropus splendidus]
MHVSTYPSGPGLLFLSFLLLANGDSPPKFTRTPEDQTGVQGGVASFVCQATGDPQPKIVWNKKGKKVSNQRFEVIEFDDGSGSVLRIQPLRTPRDEAIYECHASNSAGEITASTRLSVLREDQLPSGFPTIDMGPQLKVVERSRTATMLCAASGNPDPEITWFKDFLPVNTSTNNGRIKQLRSESFGGTPIRGALQIEMSEESDQGKYECVATNSDGTRYSTPANLYVRELREVRRVPPRFSIPPADSEIMPGGNVNITCVAVGSPMPYVKWMLGAEDLTPEDDMPIGRNVLELTDIRQSNNYTCVAMSTLGVIEAVAQIIVKALPRAPGMPVVTERTATSITLTWDSGNPEPVSYYIIQHRAKGSEDPYKEIDGIATTRYSVGGLSPYSHYDFRVAAVNTIGQGPSSEVVEARTAEQAPSSPPRQVRGRMLSTTTAIIHWDEPEEPNGQVVGYRVYYTSDNMLPVNQWEKQMVRSANFITIQSLTPNKTYYIRVLAFTSVGDGPLSQDLQIIAKTGVPSQPSEFKGEAKSETSILLSWVAPPQGGPDNQITGYELVYRKVDETEEKKVTFEPSTSYLLKDLKPFSTYTFQLAAKSKHGVGAYTNEVTIDTPQTLFATNFRVKAAMKNSILLSWEIRDKNPTQPFTILYGKGMSVEVDGKQTQKLITGLEPDTQYSFLLTNRANSAGGLQHRVTATTAPDILKTKPIVVGKTNVDGMVTVQLPIVQTTAKVRGYYVVVVPLKKQRGGKFQNPWEDPDQMNLDELLREINRTSVSRALRIRRQAAQSDPRAYISAHFKTLPMEFTLGDGRNIGDFRNRPLLNGQEYVFFVLALLDLSENTMFATSPYSDPVTSSDVDPQPRVDEEEGLLWVVGPVLAVIFIVCIVIAILLFKSKPDRKRAEAEGRKASFPCSKAMSSHHPTDPVELRRINFQTPGMASHPPIPLSELADNIERLKANDNLKFSQEYESIDPAQQFTWENSNLEVNKPKNRYANVIAYDHSRVILSSIEGVPGSDYVNANYVDGYRRQNAYIATQGSLPETFGDFWRMVWEQHTANIIMMTKLEEKSRMPSYFFSKVKCDQYWPTRGTETYGLIQVTLLDTVELATYSVRTFALYKSGSNEKREVRHFQFTAWPDHGVPEHPTPFLAFLRRVKACNPPDAGPMIVHCSAGVGRTGCFIVIDAMTERIKHEKTIDIYGHVTLMRSQRNYMVQTEDQYIFIYDALLEAVTCGNTEVPARNLYSYIQRLTQIEPGENVTGMELEFKRLASAKAHTSRFVSANLPCNKFKNRLVNIMPYETTRVCLQPIRGVEGSDYINASFIDGYRQQKAYIATQGPLAETTEDYWRMLWEHNSTIVVMLTKLREMGREKCHQYWPAERSARYQYFVVDPMAEYNMPQYILREFKVTDARDGQSRTVRQFQFTDWPEQGVPKSGEGFIDFIGQVHKTKEQFGQDGPITVHCSAGVGRTGVFITLSIVLERMRYEGVVDIFQTVKMLRTQRPATVQTEDQYQFCYRASLEYLGSFDHYAT